MDEYLYVLKSVYKGFYRAFFTIFGTIFRRLKFFILGNRNLNNIFNTRGIKNISHLKKDNKLVYFSKYFLSKDKAERFTSIFPNIMEQKISEADRICNHIFDVLGSGETNVSPNVNSKYLIDWHLDFKTNSRWKVIHPLGIDIENLNCPSDIKVPWELSRCHHMVILGQAYHLTKNEKYSKEFVSEIHDWIKSNPIGLGVNWACSMDIAIRVVNWLCSFYYLQTSSYVTSEFTSLFLRSILLQGEYIRNNLEDFKVRNNHYISDLVGLLFISELIPESKFSENWKIFSISEIKNEMKEQVNSDGVSFEGSTCYHRLVLELFFFSVLVVVMNDADFNENFIEIGEKHFGIEFINKLYSMFEFILYITKFDGTISQIGDNDNGRLFLFSNNDTLDVKYLLNYAAIFFRDSKFKIHQCNFVEDTFWVFGSKGYEIWNSLPSTSINCIVSKSFEESGYYIMRDSKVFLIIHCAENGQKGLGGHNHNDVFSFELNYQGKDIIIDPGTFNYTGDYLTRNALRSTSSHNTVSIDKQEINRLLPKKIFYLENDAKPKKIKWETSDIKDVFIGEHYGYQKLRDPVIHKRSITYLKNMSKVIIEDQFFGTDYHLLEWNLTLSPLVDKINLKSEVLVWKESNAVYSPSYGIIKQTKKLVSKLYTKLPYSVSFEINF